MTEWLLSRHAEFAQWTILLLAVANFLAASERVIKRLGGVFRVTRKLFMHGEKGSEEEPKRGRPLMKTRRSLFLGLLFACAFVGLSTSRYLVAQKLPSNARLTKEAWDAFNDKDWQVAIKKADECIEQFKDQADDMQAQLEKSHATVPDGSVSRQEKDEILKRGPLNDVGTAYWIKGQAEEKLDRNDDAKQAYQEASKYTYARCYDDSYDGFWPPADRAKGRLKHLS